MAYNARTWSSGELVTAASMNTIRDALEYLRGNAGTVSINAAMSIAGTLSSAALAVSGAATFASLSVSGAAALASLTVSGAATLASVAVSGATTLASLSVSGATTLASLTVNGSVSLTNSASITGFFSVVSPGNGSASPAGRFALTNGIGVELAPYNNGAETISYVQSLNRVTQTLAPLALTGSRVFIEGAPLLVGKASGLTGSGDLDIAGRFNADNGLASFGGAGVLFTGATNGQALVWSSANNRWQPGTIAGGGGGGSGTVTSVALSLPTIFSVTGSPITSSGTLTAALTSQAAATVLAAPTGAAGVPTFRALALADLPQSGATDGQALVWSSANGRWQPGTVSGGGGGSGTVTSVGVSVSGALQTILSVSNSPITTSGTIQLNWYQQAKNTVLAAPASGTTNGSLSFRYLDPADIPALDTAKITSGVFAVTRLPALVGATSSVAGTAGIVPAPAAGDDTKFLRGDGTWQTVAGGGGGSGSVTSVALSLPNIFAVSGSPVTTTGTLTATLASQAAATVLAAPTGAAGVPIFRALAATDIPNLDAAKITSGALGIANGGTGATTASAAYAALSPLTTRGDLVVRGASGPARLALGAAGTFARSNGTDLAYAAIVSSDLPAANIRTSGTSFPSSPAIGQAFYRTDRRRQYTYDGTRWLSEAYYVPFNVAPELASPYTATCYPGVYTLPNDIYVLEFGGYLYVNGTNNASNYWKVDIVDDATANSYGGVTTSANAANTIIQFSVTSFSTNPLVRSASTYAIDVQLTKVGAPASTYCQWYLRVCDVG